jgi:hypothetical protein
MKYHPVISIFLGIIAIFSMLFILGLVSGPIFVGISSTAGFILFFIFTIGGFTTTYFSNDAKIRYGAYTGLILSVFTIIIGRNDLGSNAIFAAAADIILISLTTGFGGFLAKLSEEDYRKSFKTKQFNKYNHIFAIVVGFVVATICGGFLELIFGINSASFNYGATDFIIGIISIFIGGFTTTFLVKEKKVRYGFFVGIIVILVGILKLYVQIIQGYIIPESYYYIRIGSYIGYLLFAGIGGYIGIILSKHLKTEQ